MAAKLAGLPMARLELMAAAGGEVASADGGRAPGDWSDPQTWDKAPWLDGEKLKAENP